FIAAPSGSGKSTLIYRLLRPFLEAEDEALDASTHELGGWRADRMVWQDRVNALRAEIRLNTVQNLNVDDLLDQLKALMADEPKPSRTASWLVQDATMPALRRHLTKIWPSVMMVLDEGIGFFTSAISRAFEDFCTLTDARLAKNERVSTGRQSIERAYCSKVIAVQNAPLHAYLNEFGQLAYETGYIGRVNMVEIQPPLPKREYDGRPVWAQALDDWDDRVKSLLRDARKRMRSNGTFEAVILHVSEKAEAVFTQADNTLKERMAAGMYSRDMGPYLARLVEHMVRIAGTIHRFEGREGEISEQTARLAVAIGFWLAHEYHEVVSRPPEPSAAERNDVQTLADALSLFVYRYRRQFLTKRELYNMAPSFGLDEARCKRSLHHLCAAGLAWLETRGNSTAIRLSPQAFPFC
ncbi:TPA: DUF3987 domain-containing protein, partial [Burkholderia vietnamiensis]|nr:DUF3987 domain-containing protein [Burkholderia vietnamiensis]